MTRLRQPVLSPVVLQPERLEPLGLVRLRSVVVAVVDGHLQPGLQVLQGGDGHDGAQDWVGGEQDELRVWFKAVVHFVGQSGVYLLLSDPISGGMSIQRLSSSPPRSRAMLYMFLSCSSSSLS